MNKYKSIRFIIEANLKIYSLLSFLIITNLFGQEYDKDINTYIQKQYPRIIEVYYGNDIPNIIGKQYKYGSKIEPDKSGAWGKSYRIIVVQSEGYNPIYVEEYKYYDEEGLDRRLINYKKIDIYKQMGLPEYVLFYKVNNIAWIDSLNIDVKIEYYDKTDNKYNERKGIIFVNEIFEYGIDQK